MREIEKDSKPTKVSGRYRKVEVRIWGDEKFRELSPIPPCGQGLFLFLITGPHTGPVPGLFRAGRAAMAEELGWEIEAFDQAFQEAFRQGLVVADFKARVMWVPNAIKHNKPESPNVVRSWAAEFDLIPECDLKRIAFDALKSSIHALGEAYGKAFDETFGKAISKPLAKPIQKTIANQEQEQEQELKGAIAPSSPASQPTTDAAEPTLDGFDLPDVPVIPPCPLKHLVALFTHKVPELPTTRFELWKDGAGADAMRQRWKWLLSADAVRADGTRYATDRDTAVEWFGNFFDAVHESDFLTGRRDGRSKFDLTWLMKKENFAKVVQGNYVNK
ncbi:hypothetical protein D9M73_90610 [compost metagenome]|nr:MAG TPA: replisome organizer [Caudoviricetes sp.]